MQLATPVEAEQLGQHAVQAYVWRMIGCDHVAAVEENVVTAFTEVGGDDNNRFTVTLNRAYKVRRQLLLNKIDLRTNPGVVGQRARQGKYDDGLAILFDPDVWRGISMDDYGLWAQKIWHILTLRASRRCVTKGC